MRKKKNSPQLPAIDGEMESAYHYRAYPWRIGKEKARAAFKFRYGVTPDQVFFGKPGGAQIYAGPVPDMSVPIPFIPRNQGMTQKLKAATIKEGIE